MHGEIKRLDAEKTEFVQSYKVANAEDTENRRQEIAQLQEKLLSATRVESRYLK